VTTHSDAGTRPSTDLDASDAAPHVRDGSADTTADAQAGEGDSGRAADGALLCRAGFADCDHDASNGCETALADDPEHCGTCDVVCGTAGVAARSCEQGSCKVTCDPNHADCNKSAKDGCEVDLAGSAANCGACGHLCGTAGATATACVAKVCKPTCDAKHGDCDGNPGNGCEIDVTTNADNCGACKRACSTANVTTRACVASACMPSKCATNFASCAAPAAPLADDGCEADLTTSTNCGGCGHNCEFGTCGLTFTGECGPYGLLANVSYPDQIVADARYIHFTQAGSASDSQLVRIPVSGAAFSPATVIDNVPIANLTTDGKFVYWSYTSNSAGGSIDRIQSGTNVDQVVRTGIPILGRLAVDPASVYWLDYGNYTVYKAAPSAGAQAAIWIDFANSVGEMQSDGTTLFVTSAAALLASNVTTKVLTSQTSLPALGLIPTDSTLTFDATHVYTWFQESATGSSTPYHLVRFDKPTLTNPVDLVATSDYTNPMFVVGNHIYYARGSVVERIATDGSGTGIEDVYGATGAVTLTATSTALYWIQVTSSGGEIRKMLVY
jgi:hypothetical protein